MAVDRHARDIMMNMLQGVLQGRLASRQLDRWAGYYAVGKNTSDEGVSAVAVELRRLAGGLRNRVIALSDEQRKAFNRTLVFLGTDLEFDADQFNDPPEEYREYFPFASPSQWKSHRHPGKDIGRPFDPQLAPPAPNFRRELGMAVLLLAAIILFVILFFWAPTCIPSLQMKVP